MGRLLPFASPRRSLALHLRHRLVVTGISVEEEKASRRSVMLSVPSSTVDAELPYLIFESWAFGLLSWPPTDSESQRLEDVDNPNAQIGIQFLYKENLIHFDF